MPHAPTFPLNAWYAIAWSHEVGKREILARTLCAKPLALWRKPDNGVAAVDGIAGDGGVDAVEVVAVGVVVVVDADDTGALAAVDPEVGDDVGVGDIEAAVDDGDDHIGRLALDVPGGGGADVDAGGAAGLAGVAQRPLIGGEAGIAGHDVGDADVVGFDVGVEAGGAEDVEFLGGVAGGAEFKRAEAAEARVGAAEAEAGGGLGMLERGGAGGGVRAGEQAAGAVAALHLFGRGVVGGGQQGRTGEEGERREVGGEAQQAKAGPPGSLG